VVNAEPLPDHERAFQEGFLREVSARVGEAYQHIENGRTAWALNVLGKLERDLCQQLQWERL